MSRALAEHALVEFDFSNDRRWSVTRARTVDVGNRITAWGGTHRSLAGLGAKTKIEERTIRIGSAFGHYRHAASIRRLGAWPQGWEPQEAHEIRNSLPSLGALLSASPRVDLLLWRGIERAFFSLPRVYDAVRGHRTVVRTEWRPAGRIVAGPGAALWRIGRRRYLFANNYIVREVDQEVGIWLQLAVALRPLGLEHAFFYEQFREGFNPIGRLTLSAFPTLPMPYVRGLLLSGAVERKDGPPDKRVFDNLAPSHAEWLRLRLGLDVLI